MFILSAETTTVYPTEEKAAAIAMRNQEDENLGAVLRGAPAWKYSVEPHANGFVIVVHDDTGYRLGRL